METSFAPVCAKAQMVAGVRKVRRGHFVESARTHRIEAGLAGKQDRIEAGLANWGREGLRWTDRKCSSLLLGS